MSSKANTKDFLNKKRKQINENEENSENNSSANLDLNEEDKPTSKITSNKSSAKNSSKHEKYNEDIQVGKDEVTLTVINLKLKPFLLINDNYIIKDLLILKTQK